MGKSSDEKGKPAPKRPLPPPPPKASGKLPLKIEPGPNQIAQIRDGLQRQDLPEELTVAHGWIGRIIDDRYLIKELLGEGGMGSVFIAEHLKLHKDVAIKIIRPDFVSDGEVAIRFAREAMATAQIDHPHVASAIDYGTLLEGEAYLVMQLVRGRSLTEVLDLQGRLHWSKACELGAQVADALSAANSHGIVHRDLKPDNILIQPRPDGTDLVKILDFGIARIRDQGKSAPAGAMPAEKLTQVGSIVGTPGYMAPEQAVGDTVDHRADLYALGVVLWETIVGRRLWETEDITSLVKNQFKRVAPPIRTVMDDETIPEELEDLISQLLSRSSADRPSQAGVVCDILHKLSYAPLTGDYPAFNNKSRLSNPEVQNENSQKTTVGISFVNNYLIKLWAVRYWAAGVGLVTILLLLYFMFGK